MMPRTPPTSPSCVDPLVRDRSCAPTCRPAARGRAAAVATLAMAGSVLFLPAPAFARQPWRGRIIHFTVAKGRVVFDQVGAITVLDARDGRVLFREARRAD